MDFIVKLIALLYELLKLSHPPKLTPSEKLKLSEDYVKGYSGTRSRMIDLANEMKDSSIFEAYYGFAADAGMREQIVKLHLTSKGRIKPSAIRAAYPFLSLNGNFIYVDISQIIDICYFLIQLGGYALLFIPFILISTLTIGGTVQQVLLKTLGLLLLFFLGILLIHQSEPVLRAKQIKKYLRERRKNDTKSGEASQQDSSELVKSNNEHLRPYGLCAGEFRVPDDFDEPLPEEIIRQFEGK